MFKPQPEVRTETIELYIAPVELTQYKQTPFAL